MINFQNIDYAVTHGGKGHFDEFTALSLALTSKDFPVYRRKPTGEELEDNEVLVVDVGGQHNPTKHNYDHHQSSSMPSSMTLVAKAAGVEGIFEDAFPWWEYKDKFDTDGPRDAARSVGVTGNTRPLCSPLEKYMLQQFGDSSGEVRKPVREFMTQYGRWLVERAGSFAKKLKKFRSEGEVREYEGVPVFILKSEIADSEVLYTLRQEKHFDATITRDPRSGDLAVYRYAETGLNLKKATKEVRKNPDITEGRVHFVHEQGFLATCETFATATRLVEIASRQNQELVPA